MFVSPSVLIALLWTLLAMRHLEHVRNRRNRKLPTDNISITNSCNRQKQIIQLIRFPCAAVFCNSHESITTASAPLGGG